ncbi:hypothetical protein O9Z70_00060 [Devosia sp. YIM 151766]|uniref:N,N-dimethylformamidase beta subunit family domain-containing protein n=1 Tax=Devosia sp. YIM 151766 TaxID=3017325 RepID=UPI00255C8B67|nr:N,N-dimethylformamidase beta subunit family domain-containing protein [Devosia sp. YIM 151766]WIY52980.1 hypothetical protein O9Z70_00060 [Devosia sp. YIM 151766]
MNIIGYADRMTVAPGETITFHVSSDKADCRAGLVRYVGAAHGQRSAQREPIAIDGLGAFTAQRQQTILGSYGILPMPQRPVRAFQLWIWPTRSALKSRQTIVHTDAWSLFIEGGRIGLEAGDVRADGGAVEDRAWYLVAGNIGPDGLDIHVERVGPGRPPDSVVRAAQRGQIAFGAENTLILAASGPGQAHYNGKIERLRLFAEALDKADITALRDDGKAPRPVADWRFEDRMSGDVLVDHGPQALEGKLHHRPARAMTGHGWDGTTQIAAHKPEQYGAIHFHDDDLADAGWTPDIALAIPHDLRSGAYGLRVDNGEEADEIPFFVTAGTASHDVLFLAPTNTYLAYANEHMAESETIDWSEVRVGSPVLNAYDRAIFADPTLGLSSYDMHSDGSGVFYSARRRPILNFRADYLSWVVGGPRHFAADLQTIGYLEQRGFDYALATDEDLDREGAALLSRYKVVLTGTHPEYWTRPMMDGLSGYLQSGGRLLYLGGNGFYWVTACTGPDRDGIEVRRGMVGTRVANSGPGEAGLSSTLQSGGLWRHCGYVPQALVGVGMAGQGWGSGAGYRRLPASYDGEGARYFRNIDAEELGHFGHVMGAVVGDEIDRLDFALGTPSHALHLATSTPLSSKYMLTHEDLLATTRAVAAPDNDLVRSDIVAFDLDGGGKVFSAGSISFAGALAWDDYDNPIATMIDNVMSVFLDRDRAANGEQ